jgi:outer membrane protein
MAVLAQPEPASVRALTLDDGYRLALRQSEALRGRAERIEQAEARYGQALGAALPRLSFNASQLYQDAGGRSDSGVGSNLTLRRRPESKFTLRQPLFSGFREFAAMSASRAEQSGERRRLERARALLYLDVARAFYLVLQTERDLANLDVLLGLLDDRLRELRERERLGKSRRSELLSLESRRDAVAAERSLTDGDAASARELLAFLTGEDVSGARLEDPLPDDFPPDAEAPLLEKADARADVLAFRDDVEARRQELRVAKGAFYPNAGLLGNYYTKRVGTQSAIDWDVLLSLEVPLFQGGATRAQAREARSRLTEAELAWEEVRREARREVKDARVRLAASLEQAAGLRSAFAKAEESYRLHVKEYRLGLVNNLEVLQALDEMESRKRDSDRAAIRGKLLRFELLSAAEALPLPAPAGPPGGR